MNRTCLRCLGLPLSFALLWAACGDRDSSLGPAGMPIHLEDLLDSAAIEGAEVPAEFGDPRTWDLTSDTADWRALPNHVGGESAEVSRAEGRLEIRLTERSLAPETGFVEHYGGAYVDVENFDPNAWSHVVIEGRSTAPGGHIGVGFEVRTKAGDQVEEQWGTVYWGADSEIDADGEVHAYRAPLQSVSAGFVQQIAVEFGAAEPADFELQSLSFIPKSATMFAGGHGVRSVSSARHEDFGPQRRTLYAHTPSEISFPLRVPAAGRLDFALGSFSGQTSMAVRVDEGDSTSVLLEEDVPQTEAWRQRSVDLSKWAGRDVTLRLIATSDEPSIALWGSPTVSSAPEAATETESPSVIFYVIDGASAGYMSVYGYERPTTPNLEELAAEGVVFDNAHSNSTWTMSSTASFMTSLHHSVLGGLRNDSNPVPKNVRTMAEHFHEAGFHTGVFTFNPNAGGFAGLERGADVFRDFGVRGNPLDPIEAISSRVLQGQFWQWRDAYPGPYWTHFQTTDVHPPHHPQDPFAGRFAPKEESEALAKEMLTFRFPFNHTSASVHEHWQEQLAERGVDPQEFYGGMQDAHDEAMLHQDARLGELVEELKARGEWQNTLLIIGSDHGHPAASYPRFGRGLLDPQPAPWEGALFGEFESHIPLIFVWPGKIEGGRRIAEPVSMIDVLPTVLDLAGLPQPDIAQGRSMAPVLLGEEGWKPGPLVFDEFRVTGDGTLIGNLEIVDGRWGRSLEIRSADLQDGEPPSTGRHPAPAGGRWPAKSFDDVARLLIYDLEVDPRAIEHVADPDPDLVAESERRLWRLWKEHRALAAQFEAGEEAELSQEQIEALKALGYVE